MDDYYIFDEEEYVNYLKNIDNIFRARYLGHNPSITLKPFLLRFKFKNTAGKTLFISFESSRPHLYGFKIYMSGSAFNEANESDLKIAFNSILNSYSGSYDFSMLEQVIDKKLLSVNSNSLKELKPRFLFRKFFEKGFCLSEKDLDRILFHVRYRVELEKRRCGEIVGDSSKLYMMGLTTLDKLEKYKKYDSVFGYISFIFNISSFAFMLYLSMYFL
ncbi:hypothetical protein N9W84_00935 [bacterium]|nr:hypothetical protein [bacterium]